MEQKMITIPFDVELAKEIQAGTKPGKIVAGDGKDVRIVCWDRKTQAKYSIVALVDEVDFEDVQYCSKAGESDKSECFNLALQVPEWTQYKDGDILACEVDNGGGDYCKWYSILNGKVDFMVSNICFRSYVSYDYDSAYMAGKLTYDELADNIDTIRLATEDEQKKFIKRLQEENTDKAKEILKRFFGIEEKPKFTFLQPVLVKNDSSKSSWKYGLFTHIVKGKAGTWYHVSGGNSYLNCVPYNGQTKHLLGTTDEWEE